MNLAQTVSFACFLDVLEPTIRPMQGTQPHALVSPHDVARSRRLSCLSIKPGNSSSSWQTPVSWWIFINPVHSHSGGPRVVSPQVVVHWKLYYSYGSVRLTRTLAGFGRYKMGYNLLVVFRVLQIVPRTSALF